MRPPGGLLRQRCDQLRPAPDFHGPGDAACVHRRCQPVDPRRPGRSGDDDDGAERRGDSRGDRERPARTRPRSARLAADAALSRQHPARRFRALDLRRRAGLHAALRPPAQHAGACLRQHGHCGRHRPAPGLLFRLSQGHLGRQRPDGGRGRRRLDPELLARAPAPSLLLAHARASAGRERRFSQPAAAGDHAGPHLLGDRRAHDALVDDRGLRRGLHPHRPRQGPARNRRAAPPRAEAGR